MSVYDVYMGLCITVYTMHKCIMTVHHMCVMHVCCAAVYDECVWCVHAVQLCMMSVYVCMCEWCVRGVQLCINSVYVCVCACMWCAHAVQLCMMSVSLNADVCVFGDSGSWVWVKTWDYHQVAFFRSCSLDLWWQGFSLEPRAILLGWAGSPEAPGSLQEPLPPGLFTRVLMMKSSCMWGQHFNQISHLLRITTLKKI